MLNNFVVQGRLVSDINVKVSNNGKFYSFFRLACRRDSKDHATDFLGIYLFGDFCNTLQKYTNKGTELIVSGSIHSRNVEENGKQITTISLIAKSINFVGGNKEYKKEDEEHDEEYEQLPF